jgi:hypothetical protein
MFPDSLPCKEKFDRTPRLALKQFAATTVKQQNWSWRRNYEPREIRHNERAAIIVGLFALHLSCPSGSHRRQLLEGASRRSSWSGQNRIRGAFSAQTKPLPELLPIGADRS